MNIVNYLNKKSRWKTSKRNLHSTFCMFPINIERSVIIMQKLFAVCRWAALIYKQGGY